MDKVRHSINTEGLQIGNVFEKLDAFNDQSKVVDFALAHNVTPEDVKQFTTYPFEIALTVNENNNLILTTNPDSELIYGTDYLKRRNTFRLNFHTHPLGMDTEISNAPSFPDLVVLEFSNKNSDAIIATPNGLIRYTLPRNEIKIGKLILKPDEPRWIAQRWGEEKYGIDIFEFGLNKKLRTQNDLTPEERIRIVREFAETSGMIIEEVAWYESRKIDRVLRIINDNK